MKTTTTAICALFAALAATLANGANWLPTAKGTYTLTDGANWDTGVAPTNSGEVANFAPGEIAGPQTISFPSDSQLTTMRLGTVQGASNQTIKLAARPSNAQVNRHLYVNDPTAFRGTWAAQDVQSRIYLTPAAGVVPSLACLDAAFSPLLYCYRGTSVVENVTGGGTIFKIGDENNPLLKIDGVDPMFAARTSVRLGTFYSPVLLDMPPLPRVVTGTPPVTDGMALRFDASRADTISTEHIDGVDYVNSWRDADGRNVTATPYTGNSSASKPHGQRPWLSNISQVNGTPLVDFGAYEMTVPTSSESSHYNELKNSLGPSASLVFNTVSGVREMFVAWQDTQSDGSRAFVLGGYPTKYKGLHRDGRSGYLLESTNGGAAYHGSDETYIDGVKRSYTYGPYDYTKLTVASMNVSKADAEGVDISTLAQDRNIRFGGCRIAEVILYTRVLTSDERVAVHEYLRRKWCAADSHHLREVCLTARDQPVGVAAGRTVDVGVLNAPAGATFVKEGDGTLNVDAIARDGLSINVNGGAVSFVNKAPVVDDSAPASGAALWLDATADSSFVRTNVENSVAGRDYIGRWNDCRSWQTKVYATPFTESVDTNRPFVVASAVNGKAVADFGTGYIQRSVDWAGHNGHDGSDAARLKLSATVEAYEGFVVLRMKNSDDYYNYYHSKGVSTSARPSIFGSSDEHFTRWGTGDYFLSQYAKPQVAAAYWTFDGVSFGSRDQNPVFGVSDFHVVAFSAENRLMIDRVADDRNLTMGGVQIGEMLLYTHRLTEQERRTTEAYLMKKWLGKASPATRDSISLNTVTFAEGATTKIASDRPVTVSKLSVPSGAVLEQSGSGSLTVESFTGSDVNSYVADGGVLNVPGPFDDAVYHFDASAADTIVPQSIVDNGDGTSTTNVAQWLDVRKNGMVARAVVGDGGFVSRTGDPLTRAYPKLVTVETKNGKMMPVMDLGEPTLASASDKSAGFELLKNGAALGSADFAGELHLIYCDSGSTQRGRRFIFSDWNNAEFHRADGGGMFSGYTGDSYFSKVRDGYIAVDATSCAYNYVLNDDKFHVISSAPTAPVPVRTIAIDRAKCKAGGSYQGELVAFRSNLSAARRLYVQKYLAWKWFGEGDEPAIAVSGLSLANGGKVSFGGSPVVSVPTIALDGAGTVSAGSVTGVSSLSFDFRSATDYDSLTVEGDFVFANGGTITVNVGSGVKGAGDYPIVSANALRGGNPLEWTCTIVNNTTRYNAQLVVVGNTLCLRLTPLGAILIVL